MRPSAYFGQKRWIRHNGGKLAARGYLSSRDQGGKKPLVATQTKRAVKASECFILGEKEQYARGALEVRTVEELNKAGKEKLVVGYYMDKTRCYG